MAGTVREGKGKGSEAGGGGDEGGAIVWPVTLSICELLAPESSGWMNVLKPKACQESNGMDFTARHTCTSSGTCMKEEMERNATRASAAGRMGGCPIHS